MPFTYVDNDGNEIEAFTKDELDAELSTKVSDYEAQITKMQTELQEKSQNIQGLRRLNEMTAEEKSKLSQAEIESRMALEKLQEELNATKTTLTDYHKKELEDFKQGLVRNIIGDNEDLKAKFDEEYALFGIEEKDKESIAKRVEKTARLVGVTPAGSGANPLNAFWNGSAPSVNMQPKSEPQKEKEEFFNSEKGKYALEMLNIKSDNQ